MKTLKHFTATLLLFLAAFNLNAQTSGCLGFRTQTQGGWGSKPKGNNPGSYLHAHFDNTFPNGLIIGCNNALVLTTANDVTQFLPSGSTASQLPIGTTTNPGKKYKNVLAGQLVAATLTVGFDMTDASFGANQTNIVNLVITQGPFTGQSVGQLLAEANSFIGGCSSSYSATQLNEALTSFNESFVDGNASGNFLTCPGTPPLAIATSKTDASCFGSTDGEATVSVTTGDEPFTYMWSNGATTSTVSGLAAGTYDVTVHDTYGQQMISTVVIDQPTEINLAASVELGSCLNGYSTALYAEAAGGAGSFSYVWSDGTMGAENIIATSGDYSVTATDASGCTAETELYQQVAEPLNMNITSTWSSTFVYGSATAHISGGLSPYTYEWSNGEITAEIIQLNSGFYNLVVTDANGCIIEGSIYVGPSFNKWQDLSEEVRKQMISVYPNPASLSADFVVNTSKMDGDISFLVINSAGQIVSPERNAEANGLTRFSDLNTAGVYTVLIKRNGTLIDHRNVVVAH